MGFKPMVASEKLPGGFDSHPLPLKAKTALTPSFTGSEPFLIGPDIRSQAATPGHLRTPVTTTSINFHTASTSHWGTLYSNSGEMFLIVSGIVCRKPSPAGAGWPQSGPCSSRIFPYRPSKSPARKLGLLRRDDRWKSFLAGDESHGDRIDAVARVLGGHSFTMKNMPQVAAAIPANNFGAMSVRVLTTINGFGHLIIEAGPTAIAFELVVGSVKRRVAPSANKRARIFQIRVLAGEWLLRAFANDDARFFRRQFVVPC